MTPPRDDHGHGHPSLVVIAELAGGDLPAEQAGPVSAHVETCPSCGEHLARIETVRHALTYLPSPVTPPAVADRIQQAIAREPLPAAPVVAAAAGTPPAPTVLATRHRHRWTDRLPATAAAAAVLALAGGLSYLAVGAGGHGHPTSSAGSAAGGTSLVGPPAPTISHTGRHYTAASLQRDAGGLLATRPDTTGQGRAAAPASPATTGSAGAAMVTPGAVGGGGSTYSVPAPLVPLQNTAAIDACAAHTGYAGQPVLAVDYAYFDGKPSLILVFADRADPQQRLRAIVAPPTCATDPAPLFTTVEANR